MRNRCQNTAKNNARTGIEKDQGNHQKSYFSESEIIEIHWKNNGFWQFRRLHMRTVKVSKKHQKWYQIPSEIQWKIDTKNMLEKREPKYEHSSKKWSKNGANIHQKSFQNRCEKRDKKRNTKPWPGVMRVVPKPNHFKRHPSAENKRRKPTEGWVQSGVQKVECKRQVQKGKCRQGTHNGPKHARWPATTCGYMGYRLFHRPQVSFLFVIVFVCLGFCDYGIVGL